MNFRWIDVGTESCFTGLSGCVLLSSFPCAWTDLSLESTVRNVNGLTSIQIIQKLEWIAAQKFNSAKSQNCYKKESFHLISE